MEPLPKQGCELVIAISLAPGTMSQWNPCRSRGARHPEYAKWKKERVSVEPLPKQGCEQHPELTSPAHSASQWNPCRSRGARRCRPSTVDQEMIVSVEPLPKQGCEIKRTSHSKENREVSVEPLPKQGCEAIPRRQFGQRSRSLSGTPAEAGVRDAQVCRAVQGRRLSQWNPCRSRGARR